MPNDDWTDRRLDDAFERQREDVTDLKKGLGRIEAKVDAIISSRWWTPATIAPVIVGFIASLALVLTKGVG